MPKYKFKIWGSLKWGNVDAGVTGADHVCLHYVYTGVLPMSHSLLSAGCHAPKRLSYHSAHWWSLTKVTLPILGILLTECSVRSCSTQYGSNRQRRSDIMV